MNQNYLGKKVFFFSACIGVLPLVILFQTIKYGIHLDRFALHCYQVEMV